MTPKLLATELRCFVSEGNAVQLTCDDGIEISPDAFRIIQQNLLALSDGDLIEVFNRGVFPPKKLVRVIEKAENREDFFAALADRHDEDDEREEIHHNVAVATSIMEEHFHRILNKAYCRAEDCEDFERRIAKQLVNRGAESIAAQIVARDVIEAFSDMDDAA